MDSKIALRPVRSTSFALHMDRLPACNQSLSNMTFQYNLVYERKPECFQYQNLVPLLTDSAFRGTHVHIDELWLVAKPLLYKATCSGLFVGRFHS